MCNNNGVPIPPREFKNIWPINLRVLSTWCTVGADVENGKFAMLGARMGSFYTVVDHDNYDFNVSDLDGMADYFHNTVQPANIDSELEMWGNSLRQQLARVGAGDGRRPAAGVEALEQDSDLRALANLLHAGDFEGFGFQPEPADFQDPELKDLIERCLVVGDSHSLPLTNLTPEMRWYYGRTSPRPTVKRKPTRRWRPQP